MLAALGKKLINANITITRFFEVVQRNFFLENLGIYYLKKVPKSGKKRKKIVELCLRNGFIEEYIQLSTICKFILFW